MAHSDVKITGTGLPPGTPIGATITFQLGSIPTASVHLAPAGSMQVGKQGFGNIDKLKRQKASVDISVKIHTGVANAVERKLKFSGLLDGMSLSNMVGSNNYEAVIKNKAQTLLEITTMMPGLLPVSVNPYKNTDHALVTVGQGGNGNEAEIAWGKVTRGISARQHPLGFYTDVMRMIIYNQKKGWEDLRGTDGCLAGGMPYDRIFNDPRYQKALDSAQEMFKNVNMSAVSGGSIGNIKVDESGLQSQLQSIFIQGSNVLLENYMNFLNTIGCSLIFSNNQMIVVPQNSVIKQVNKPTGKGALQSLANCAGPADYTAYTYSDNGYRDVCMVVVQTANVVGGHHVSTKNFDTGAVSYFAESAELSQASGVIVVNAHPFMTISASAPSPIDSKQARQDFDDGKHSLYKKKKSYTDALSNTAKKHADTANKKVEAYDNKYKTILDNFAETKFYQTRFQDRHGSITMDFNPNWVPGTGGSLFVRETQSFINFYVNSVSHRVESTAPNNGTALTTVNFHCGRFGTDPAGAEEDKYLGYDLDAEQTVQQAFLKDIV
jgi:hypothetical protein